MKLSKEALEHLKQHVEYPISKVELLKTCDNWSDVGAVDKKAAQSLPNKTFNNANEVLQALNM